MSRLKTASSSKRTSLAAEQTRIRTFPDLIRFIFFQADSSLGSADFGGHFLVLRLRRLQRRCQRWRRRRRWLHLGLTRRWHDERRLSRSRRRRSFPVHSAAGVARRPPASVWLVLRAHGGPAGDGPGVTLRDRPGPASTSGTSAGVSRLSSAGFRERWIAWSALNFTLLRTIYSSWLQDFNKLLRYPMLVIQITCQILLRRGVFWRDPKKGF